MKKMLMALSLLVAHHFSYGQTMYSEFNQYTWDGILPGSSSPSGPKCPSFSVMCVDIFAACPSYYQQWHRIGSPDQLTTPTGGTPLPNPSDIHLFSVDNTGEGIFTSFTFMPPKTYKITVGVKYANTLGATSSAVGSGMLVLGAVDNLVETPTGTSPCSQGKLFTQSGTTWSLNATNNTTLASSGDVIGTITPAYANPGGPTVDYFLMYTPSTLTNEFSIQYYNDHSSGSQQDISLDYVKIEEVCTYNSNFGYQYSTFNPLDVTFMPYTYSAPAPYSWQFGDGGVSSTPGTVNYTYPSYGTYHPSLAIGDCLRQFAKVCLNQPDVNNYIPGNTSDPIIDPNNNTNPCNPHFEFFGGSTNPYEVGITTLGGHTGTNAFNVVWGDGTNSTSNMPQSFIHTYSSPGSYNICVEADDKRCTVCLPICIEQLGTGDNGGGGPYGGGGEGKQGITSVSNKVVPITINSIVPNPAKSMVTLSIDGKIDAKASVKIFDITGKAVITTEKNISIGVNKIDLDVQNLTAGVYIIEVKAGSESIARAKMTKE